MGMMGLVTAQISGALSPGLLFFFFFGEYGFKHNIVNRGVSHRFTVCIARL